MTRVPEGNQPVRNEQAGANDRSIPCQRYGSPPREWLETGAQLRAWGFAPHVAASLAFNGYGLVGLQSVLIVDPVATAVCE